MSEAGVGRFELIVVEHHHSIADVQSDEEFADHMLEVGVNGDMRGEHVGVVSNTLQGRDRFGMEGAVGREGKGIEGNALESGELGVFILLAVCGLCELRLDVSANGGGCEDAVNGRLP